MHDLHVCFSPPDGGAGTSPSASWSWSNCTSMAERAHFLQTRLHRMGYGRVDGGGGGKHVACLAFCRTIHAGALFGADGRVGKKKSLIDASAAPLDEADRKRLEMRVDADRILPWEVVLPKSMRGSDGDGEDEDGADNDETKRKRGNGKKRRKKKNVDVDVGDCGRRNKFGTRILRRLNLVVEEASEASRLVGMLRDDIDDDDVLANANGRDSIVRRLLRKYDLLSVQPMSEPTFQIVCQGVGGGASVEGGGGNGNTFRSMIDIISMEYATGSRGGLGTPYRLRAEFMKDAVAAGVAFELCYGPAILDPKRRKGFFSTLLEFRTATRGIYKPQKARLIVSSGPRVNYSTGTGDCGALALRSRSDVLHLVGMHYGGNNIDGGRSKGDELLDDDDVEDSNEKGGVGAVMGCNAARAVRRGGDRRTGGVVRYCSSNGRGGASLRCMNKVVSEKHEDGDDMGTEDEDATVGKAYNSLVAWLSVPVVAAEKRKREKAGGDNAVEDEKGGRSGGGSGEGDQECHSDGVDASGSDDDGEEECKSESGDDSAEVKEEKDGFEDGFISIM